jgi:hypothetical protein
LRVNRLAVGADASVGRALSGDRGQLLSVALLRPSRSSCLLALVRKLIDYGRDLAATVRQRVAAEPSFVRTCFGTADLAVIFARITRGLLLAQALEERVLRRAATFDKGPRPRKGRPACKPKPTALDPGITPPAAEAAEPGSALAPGLDPGVPTAEQIAAEACHRA